MVIKMISYYGSIVDEKIKEKIPEAEWTDNLLQYASYKCEIDGLIAAASLFCPDVVVVNGYIFIKYLWNISDEEESIEYINELEKRFGYNKKQIEKYVNTWSLGDFFVGDNSPKMNDIDILNQFGCLLCYFWKSRLKELFPKKEFEVILGKEMEGEIGLCISMYEK